MITTNGMLHYYVLNSMYYTNPYRSRIYYFIGPIEPLADVIPAKAVIWIDVSKGAIYGLHNRICGNEVEGKAWLQVYPDIGKSPNLLKLFNIMGIN